MKEENNDEIKKLKKQIDNLKKEKESLQDQIKEEKESVKYWKSIVDNSPIDLAVLDSTGKILYINRVFPGNKLEEVIGSFVFDYIPAEYHNRVKGAIKTAKKTGKKQNYTIKFEMPDGNVSWWTNIIIPFKMPGNKTSQRFISQGIDITESKETEERLKDSQLFIEKITETVPNLIYVYDIEKNQNIYSNNKVTELLGYSAKEVKEMGENLLPTVIHPEDAKKAYENFNAFPNLSDTDILETEYRVIHRDGNWRWFLSWEKIFKRSSEGNPLQVIGIVQDITERKNIEVKLEKTLIELETILDNALVGIAYVKNNTFVWINNRMAEMFGYTNKEDLKDPAILSPMNSYEYDDDRSKVLEELKINKSFKRKKHLTQKKDGTILWCSVSGNCIEDGDDLSIIWVIEDITEQIINEERLENYRNHLEDMVKERTNKLEHEISERKKTENALRESEEMYNALLNAPTDIILMLDKNSIVLDINSTGAKMLNTSVEKIKGKDIYDFLPSGIAKMRKYYIEKTFTEKKTQRFEDEFHGIWFDNILYPIYGPNNTVIKVAVYGRDITTRIQTENKIKENLHFMQALLDSIPNPIFYNDTKGIYIGCNTAFEDYLGYSRKNIIGKSVFDVSPKKLADKYHQMDMDLISNGGLQTYETKVLHADNTEHHVIFYKATFNNLDGTSGGIIGTIIDITDRKNTEIALTESENKYRILFESIVNPVFLVDKETGRIIDTNSSASKLYGYERQELLTLRNIDLSAEPEKTREATLKYRSYIPIRYHRKKDGSLLPVEILASEIVLNKRVMHIVTIQDITRRLKDEKKIRNSEAMLKAILNNNQQAFVLIGKDYKVVILNKIASILSEELFGIELKEGISLNDLLEYIKVINFEEYFNKAIKGEYCTSEVSFVSIKGKKHWMSIDYYPVVTEDNEIMGICLAALDITERKQSEEISLQSSKLAAIGEMAAGMAHELNQPITAIKLFIEILKDLTEEDEFKSEDFKTNLNNIHELNEKINSIVKEVRYFARPSQNVLTKVCLNEVVKKSLQILRPQYESAGVTFDIQFDKELSNIFGNSNQLEQVVINILRNAAESVDSTKVKKITIVTFETSSDIHLSIKDTGSGIPEESLNKLFIPFYTTKVKGEGMGLGLSICYRIIKEHDGSIVVRSELGTGTEFEVVIPKIIN